MRRLKESCGVLTLIALSFAPWGHSDKADGSDIESESPGMQRLLNAFVGKWAVKETFDVTASKRGKTREGTATFRTGPGPTSRICDSGAVGYEFQLFSDFHEGV